MHGRIAARLALAGALSLQACRGGHGERANDVRRGAGVAEPVVHRLGTIDLTENDTAYLGRPAALSVDPEDGSLYVTDAFWGRVLRFSPSGALVRMYGRRGEGPGELKSPGTVEVVDSAVVVLDVNRLTRYAREDGRFLGSTRFSGTLTSLRPLRGRLWMAGLNLAQHASLATWAPGEGAVRALGTIPPQFTESEPLAGIYTGAELAVWGDTVLVGYEGLNRLTLFHTDGRPIRALSVPVRARKGELPNVVEAMKHLDFPGQFSANSVLFRLERMPSGNFALVHYDQMIEGDLITARVFLSLLAPDFSRACVDREIPVSRDAQPYTAFRGDTLYVVQQQVSGERSKTLVDRWLIDELACPGVPARTAKN
jgi:hypothetical protein